MRGMKTARALSEIDDDLILEAMPANTITVTRKAPWKYIAMASSIALVLCIGIFAVIIGSKSGSKYIDTDSTSTSSEYEKRYVDPDSSAADENGRLSECSGDTSIFIYPGYKFKVLDQLITNFHLPESTLVMLVSALAGREHVLNAYQEAIKEKYRFFSFGDACFFK